MSAAEERVIRHGGGDAGQAPVLDHVGFSVPVLEDAVTWYQDALGMTALPVVEIGNGLRACILVHPDTEMRLELLHRPDACAGEARRTPFEAAGRWGIGHVCMRVSDVAVVMKQLVAAGAEVQMPARPSPRAGATIGFVSDPWGNLLELITRE